MAHRPGQISRPPQAPPNSPRSKGRRLEAAANLRRAALEEKGAYRPDPGFAE